MKQYIVKFLGSPTSSLREPRSLGILVVFGFIILCSCLLFQLFRRPPHPGLAETMRGTTATPLFTLPTLTPTAWWIKTTPSPALNSRPAPFIELTGMPASGCPVSFSSPLRSGIYAYISLTSPLPNRIRSGAGKANSYLGEIEPGGGVRVLDGPVCADGFSWWLVESTQDGLRGWTAEGRASEQWVIPCPNQTAACMKKLASPAASPSSEGGNKNKDQLCSSDKLAVGILAQVEQDSLLAIRSKPNSRDVVGRAGPLTVVDIVGGPVCAGKVVWWQVNISALHLAGWAIENNLSACSKKDECS